MVICRLNSLRPLIFHKPQTSDCIDFPLLLALGAGKERVHIGQISQRLLRVAMHLGDVITVADHVVHHSLLCILYSMIATGNSIHASSCGILVWILIASLSIHRSTGYSQTVTKVPGTRKITGDTCMGWI